MNGSIATARIYTDFGGLAKLKAAARDRSPEATKEVARQFEALFLQMMLKSMRQAGVIADGVESDQVKFYQQMFDQQVALELAGHQTIGLAAYLERGLQRPPALSGAKDGMALPPRRHFAAVHGKAAPSRSEPSSEPSWPPADPIAFVERLWPAAKRAANLLGVQPEAILAQAALESGWGRRTPRSGAEESFNLFGIKADHRWKGDRVTLPTVEYRDGVAVKEQAAFRSYASPEESIEDYAAFLQENPRYRNALEKTEDAARFVEELQKAGYATDPAYAAKVGRILSSEKFAQAVAKLKAG